MSALKTVLSIGSKKFKSFDELKLYQKTIKQNKELKKAEQDWFDKYFQPVVDFMGDDVVWAHFGIKPIHRSARPQLKEIKISENQAIYKGRKDGGHWYSHRAGSKKWFDAYEDKYQIPGTNQFCQTFALLNILDKLPKNTSSPKIEDYYRYTKFAIKFIGSLVALSGDSVLKKQYAEIEKHPYLCFNGIEV